MPATDTLTDVPKKPKDPGKPNGGGKKKPNRSPSYALFARIDLDLAEAMDDYLASIDVQPTLAAITKTAIREFLAKRGFWPRKPKPPDNPA